MRGALLREQQVWGMNSENDYSRKNLLIGVVVIINIITLYVVCAKGAAACLVLRRGNCLPFAFQTAIIFVLTCISHSHIKLIKNQYHSLIHCF